MTLRASWITPYPQGADYQKSPKLHTLYTVAFLMFRDVTSIPEMLLRMNSELA